MTTMVFSEHTTHLLELTKMGDDAFNAHDFPAMDKFHHPDLIAHLTGIAAPTVGTAPHEAMVERMVRAFPDIRVLNDPYPVQLGSGDWVTVVTRVQGSFVGELILDDGTVIPPTGKSFDVDFSKTIRWEGDLMREEYVFWDAEVQAQQLGLV